MGEGGGMADAAQRGGSLGHVLVTCVKNEGPYLVEFVAHHRVLGFDLICIASNDCTDGTDRLLRLLARGGAIRHARNVVPEGESPAHTGYRLMRRKFRLDRAAWLMAMDVDEFLYVSTGAGRVHDLTGAAPPDVDVIALSSLTFGAGDPGQGWTPERVCARFTRRVQERHRTNEPVKSLTRDPARFREIHNHSMVGFRPDRPARVMRGNGTVFDLDPALPIWRQLRNFRWRDIGHNLAHYNHYSIKSAEEFRLRRARGRGVDIRKLEDKIRHTDDYFAERAAAAVIEDRRILDRYGPAVEAEMARLLALPGVAEAQARCEARTAKAIRRLQKAG